MSDVSVATLGFAVDTTALRAASDALDKLSRVAASTEAAIARMASVSSASFAKVGAGASSAGGATSLAAQVAQQTQLATATEATTTKVRGQATALKDAAAAHDKHGSAVKINANKMQELEHVGRALFDEMAAGRSVLGALGTEFGRLFQVFGPGKSTIESVVSKFKDIPLAARFAGGALAAAAATSVAAFASWEAGQDRLANSLNGIGRRSGATLGQLNAIAAAGAQASGLSLSGGISLAAQYTAAGLAPSTAETLIGSTRAFGRVTGLGTDQAGETLAAAIRDPIRGLAELDKSLGFVDDGLKQNVINLAASGHLQEAQALETNALSAALKHTTDTTWGLGRAMEDAERRAGNAFSGLGHGIVTRLGYGTNAEQLAADQSEQARLRVIGPFKNASRIADLQKDIDQLQGVLNAAAAAAAKNQREALAATNSQRAGDVVRTTEPDLGRYQTLVNQRDQLQTALSDPDTAKLIDPAAARDAQDALDRLNTGLATFKSSAEQAAETSRFVVAAIQADDESNKLVVRVQQAYAETLERTHSALEAAVAAESRRNEAIARANEEADDAARTQRDADALLGLRPAQRLALERQQGHEEADRKYDGVDPDYVKVPTSGGAYLQAPAAVQKMIDAAAAQTGVPAAIIAAIGQKENGFRLTGGTSLPGSDGRPSSAYGFGQLTNGAAADVGRVLPGFDRRDPSTAVLGSAEYLKILLDRNGGNQTAALNAYGGTSGYAADIARRAGGGIALPTGLTAPAGTGEKVASDQVDRHYDAQYANLVNAPLQSAQDTLAQRQAAQAITEQSAGFDRFGMSASAAAGKLAELNERQDLLNTYARDGVTVTPELTAKVDDLARRYGDAARDASKFAAEQRQITSELDAVRSGFGDGLSTFVNDLERGKGAGSAFRDVLEGLGQTIQKAGLNAITGSLFGGQGSTGSNAGLFGGLLTSAFKGIGGLFSGGGSIGGIGHNAVGTDSWIGGPTVVGESGPELVNLPRGAQVVPNSTLASMGASVNHTYQFGDVHIHAVGGAQFTPDQLQQIRGQVVAGQQETVDHITRNMTSIQANSRQSSRLF